MFPQATFFESTSQLAKLLSELKSISKLQIDDRKKIASNISGDNITDLFNYSNLSNELKNIILNWFKKNIHIHIS